MIQTKHLVAALAAAFAGVSIAAVTADEAKQLGGPALTTFGSEKAGNKEGTIPPYTGEGEVYSQIRIDSDAPSRRSGEKLVIVDPLDFVGVGRRAYQYIPGQRRVKLAPDLAYDTPSPMGGGSATMDDAIAFLGALDRYEFKLVGKKEKFIMYNNYKMNDRAGCSDTKILSTKNFPTLTAFAGNCTAYGSSRRSSSPASGTSIRAACSIGMRMAMRPAWQRTTTRPTSCIAW